MEPEFFRRQQTSPLRFHWRLPCAGETSALAMADQSSAPVIGLPDPDLQASFCRYAEESGIDSLLVDFGFAKPYPMLLAAMLGTKAFIYLGTKNDGK
jgi:alkanesulfonate monooxygenase